MNKNIILAGIVAIGIYLFSQAKKIPFITVAQKTAQRSPSATTPTVRQRTAQKIAQKIAQKVAQKVAPKILVETGGRTGMALVIYLIFFVCENKYIPIAIAPAIIIFLLFISCNFKVFY